MDKYALYTVGLDLLKLYAPFMPYVTETLYQTLYRAHENTSSLHQRVLLHLKTQLKMTIHY